MLIAYLADAGCICVLRAHDYRSQMQISASRADPRTRLSYSAQLHIVRGGEHYFHYSLQIQRSPSYSVCIKLHRSHNAANRHSEDAQCYLMV